MQFWSKFCFGILFLKRWATGLLDFLRIWMQYFVQFIRKFRIKILFFWRWTTFFAPKQLNTFLSNNFFSNIVLEMFDWQYWPFLSSCCIQKYYKWCTRLFWSYWSFGLWSLAYHFHLLLPMLHLFDLWQSILWLDKSFTIRFSILRFISW